MASMTAWGLMAAGIVLAVACSEGAAERSACSEGTPYALETVFPSGRPPGDAPECVLRCGDTSKASWGASGRPYPTISAAPTGACRAPDEVCTMRAVRPCGRPEYGTALTLTCRCEGGTWSCREEYLGGGGCSLAVDAGAPDAF